MTEQANDKQRLVVVDDNVDTARLSAMMLRMQGFEVETAHDGEARSRPSPRDVSRTACCSTSVCRG